MEQRGAGAAAQMRQSTGGVPEFSEAWRSEGAAARGYSNSVKRYTVTGTQVTSPGPAGLSFSKSVKGREGSVDKKVRARAKVSRVGGKAVLPAQAEMKYEQVRGREAVGVEGGCYRVK